MNDQNSWIFLPEWIEFYTAEVEDNFTLLERKTVQIIQKDNQSIQAFSAKIRKIQARFIKIHAKNIKQCPTWHKGSGGNAWLFVDEIIVK